MAGTLINDFCHVVGILLAFCKWVDKGQQEFQQSLSVLGSISPCRSEHVSISWLRSLLVGDHFVLKADQNLLHVVLRVPLFEHVELGWLNNSVRLVDTRQVDFGVEFDCWRNIPLSRLYRFRVVDISEPKHPRNNGSDSDGSSSGSSSTIINSL